MSWGPALSGKPEATVVLNPADHSAAPQQLRLTLTSATILKLAPGRYQLTTTTPLMTGHRAYGWNIELALFDPVNYVRLSQENAVRVAAGDVIEPASPHLVTAKAPAAPRDASSEVDARPQIIALLNRWAASLRARELRAHMSCYAPRLARYFQQRNVSWAQVQTHKRKLLELYTQIRMLDLSDIDVTIDHAQASGAAIMKWDFTNHEVESRGKAPLHFEFAQMGSRWLITSEWQGPVPEKVNSAAVR